MIVFFSLGIVKLLSDFKRAADQKEEPLYLVTCRGGGGLEKLDLAWL